MRVSKKSAKTPGSPYKVLYWMGAALALLAVGVVALIMLQPEKGPPPDPERAVLWLYDASAQGQNQSAVAIVIEESRSRGQLAAVPFRPGSDLSTAAASSPKKAQDLLQTQLERKLHHRVFLPYSVVSLLVDAAGGIRVDGQAMSGAQAVAYVAEGGDKAAQRAASVMLAMAKAVNENGVDMSASEGLRLARQVDTDIDLMAIPDVLSRWSGYSSPRVLTPSAGETSAIRAVLLPDGQPGQ
jgi:hypothetical protein